ncbi:MAG: thioredoxin [Candidatus Omnitrophica bacterium 4484_70.2]|nr:MAG: thioredoxin [Candidatus Omnitrophica bacterium 4484_70.2]
MEKEQVLKLTDDNFKEEVINSELPVVVDFWAPWCMPCRMISPIIEEIAKEYEDKVKVGKLNVDEAPHTASFYGIMAIPTLLIFKGGEVKEKIVGVISKETLASKIASYI